MRLENTWTRLGETMPPRKRRGAATAPSPAPDLPANLLAEIAARSDDAATIFRCAATCKLLRREILSPDIIRRVTGGPDAAVPSSVLGVVGKREASFSIMHASTVVAWTFARRHLAPFVSRRAAGLLDQYVPVTSRRGFLLLERRGIESESWMSTWEPSESDLCVYDPMTDNRTFFSVPPDIVFTTHYVLLTAADGIGCSFMLLAADITKNVDCPSRIEVQTVSSSSDAAGGGGEWGSVRTADHDCPWWCMNEDAAVVLGGVVHWLMHAGASFLESDVIIREYILTYDVNTATVGSIDLPKDREHASLKVSRSSQLASLPDGKLSFIAVDQLAVTIWVLSGGGSSWERHWEVDMEAAWYVQPREERGFEFVSFGDQRSGVVFLRLDGGLRMLYGIDVETKTTFVGCFDERTGIPCEVDLASRLSSMKAY